MLHDAAGLQQEHAVRRVARVVEGLALLALQVLHRQRDDPQLLRGAAREQRAARQHDAAPLDLRGLRAGLASVGDPPGLLELLLPLRARPGPPDRRGARLLEH